MDRTQTAHYRISPPNSSIRVLADVVPQAYPISRNTIFNLSTAHPDDHFAAEPTASWTTKADKKAMLDVYADFCSPVMRLLQLVPEGEVCEWKLRVHDPLTTWVEGNFALVGDACHPTLPVGVHQHCRAFQLVIAF